MSPFIRKRSRDYWLASPDRLVADVVPRAVPAARCARDQRQVVAVPALAPALAASFHKIVADGVGAALGVCTIEPLRPSRVINRVPSILSRGSCRTWHC